MKKFITPGLFIFMFLALTTFSGCGAIESIFKAGVWVGIIAVVAIIAIIGFIVKSFGGK